LSKAICSALYPNSIYRIILRRCGWLLIPGLYTLVAQAGPPFITDDPEPVDYQHLEFYTASQSTKTAAGWSLTAPHFEFNYGVLPDMMIHIIAPMAYSAPTQGPVEYG
jgi:hypothetical protein